MFNDGFRGLCLLLCVSVGAAVWNAPAAAESAGRAQANKNGDVARRKEVKFEVISIRPVMPGSGHAGYNPNPTPDGFVSSLSIWQMLMIAYAPDDQSWGTIPIIAHSRDAVSWGGQLSIGSAPKWLGDAYTINARVSDADREAWRNQSKNHEQLRSAMRDLLKERCKLVVEVQPTQLPDVKLVIGKKGLKRLKASVPGFVPPNGAYPLPTGGFRIASERTSWHYYGATIGELVDFLSPPGTGSPAPPVHDETGLSGRYDFTITMVDEPSHDVAESMYNWPVGPMGLELKPGKYTGVELVIEQMEKPAAN